MVRLSRFKKRSSDRSGFDSLERSLIKDGPWKVGGDERDTPPPSKTTLGGEGDVSRGAALTNNDFQIGDLAEPATTANPIVYVTAAGGVTPTYTHPFMLVMGSNLNVTVTADPQIAVGVEGNKLTLVGAGSTIRLSHGTGIIMVGSVPFIIGLSSTIVFMYHTAGDAWAETSRTYP